MGAKEGGLKIQAPLGGSRQPWAGRVHSISSAHRLSRRREAGQKKQEGGREDSCQCRSEDLT